MKLAFEHCAADYAVHRPGYPPEVFAALESSYGPAKGRPVLDVGAGTGLATRPLAEGGYRVFAVEPGMAMLRQNRDQTLCRHPGAEVSFLCARAEAIPLADQTADLIAAFQAFHWFNPPYALAQFARLLRPGGALALCWNNRDAAGSEFVGAYEKLIATYNPAYKREYRQQDWAGKIAASGWFEPAQLTEFTWAWTLFADAFVGFTRSVSYIRNVLSRQTRPLFERDVRSLIDRHFSDGPCRIPMRTQLWTARRIRLTDRENLIRPSRSLRRRT